MRVDIGGSRRAVGVLGEGIPAAGKLAAIAEHLQTVAVGELDGMMVEDFAHVLSDAHLPDAHSLGLDGVRVGEPVADVDVVDVLLADVVAAEPSEVVPVAHLVLHLGLIRPARPDPDAAHVQVHPYEFQFADGPVVDAFDEFTVFHLVSQVMAHGHGQLFFLRFRWRP